MTPTPAQNATGPYTVVGNGTTTTVTNVETLRFTDGDTTIPNP